MLHTVPLLWALWAASLAAIWPLPSSYSHGDSVLWIDPSVRILYNGTQVDSFFSRYPIIQALSGLLSQTLGYSSSSENGGTSGIVSTAIQRTYTTLFDQNFVPWKFHPRNSNFQPGKNESSIYITSIALQQTAADPATIIKPADGAIDESYSSDMTSSGTVTITAATSIGLAYGLTTLTQSFYKHTDGCIYTPSAPVKITDSPTFPHRGLNMDVARAYYAPSDILRMIDALAYNKMNRLHIHATDSQSWPSQIPSLPLLAAKGAYEAGLSYSPATLASIQDYGALRGVEVYIEIDMPGHTSSIAFGYPDLIAAFNVQPNWDSYAAEPPSGTLKLNSSAVTTFSHTSFANLSPRVAPYTSYFHTGGDEVNANAYTSDETVGTNDTAVSQPLMQAFVDRNHASVRAAGSTPIVWEEMSLQWNSTSGSDVIVQTWQSDEAVAQTVAKGHKASVGNYEFWYLDCGQGQWLDFRPGASSAEYWPYADYCSPRHNWRVMYSYDPLNQVPQNLTHLVLGGEAHIWSEQTDPISLDRMVWPRACAAGEVSWSGAKDASGQNRSQITASPRLSEMRERLVARGVMAEPIQMPFCTQNGTQCAL